MNSVSFSVLAQCLDTERLFAERLNTDFVVVGFVLVSAFAMVRPRQIRTMVGG